MAYDKFTPTGDLVHPGTREALLAAGETYNFTTAKTAARSLGADTVQGLRACVVAWARQCAACGPVRLFHCALISVQGGGNFA